MAKILTHNVHLFIFIDFSKKLNSEHKKRGKLSLLNKAILILNRKNFVSEQ